MLLKWCFNIFTRKMISRNIWVSSCKAVPFRAMLHSVEITEIYSHIVGKYFVKLTFLLKKEVKKELFWRNIFFVRLNFSFFHTVQHTKYSEEITQNSRQKYFVKSAVYCLVISLVKIMHPCYFHEIFAKKKSSSESKVP